MKAGTRNKSRKRRLGTRKQNKKPLIQHYHLIVRCEIKHCPVETDKEKMEKTVNELIKSIDMAPLAPAKVYYMKTPAFNEGMTCIAPIETSHISFHFWKRPERKILGNPESRCLLQMDVYTCGTLNKQQQKNILTFLSEYEPTRLNMTLLNRITAMSIDKVLSWDKRDRSYAAFLADEF